MNNLRRIIENGGEFWHLVGVQYEDSKSGETKRSTGIVFSQHIMSLLGPTDGVYNLALQKTAVTRMVTEGHCVFSFVVNSDRRSLDGGRRVVLATSVENELKPTTDDWIYIVPCRVIEKKENEI